MKLGIPEFTVNKKIQSSYCCSACEGTGEKRREWRNKVLISKCDKCEGDGRILNTTNTEVPLIEALEEMGIVLLYQCR
jgi:DnaJ-class molecular chaperone